MTITRYRVYVLILVFGWGCLYTINRIQESSGKGLEFFLVRSAEMLTTPENLFFILLTIALYVAQPFRKQ